MTRSFKRTVQCFPSSFVLTPLSSNYRRMKSRDRYKRSKHCCIRKIRILSRNDERRICHPPQTDILHLHHELSTMVLNSRKPPFLVGYTELASRSVIMTECNNTTDTAIEGPPQQSITPVPFSRQRLTISKERPNGHTSDCPHMFSISNPTCHGQTPVELG